MPFSLTIVHYRLKDVESNVSLCEFQAKYDASELITQRDAVSNSVADDLTRRAETFGIYLDDISITHLTFGSDFARAVESKQVAQQEAERSRYYVEKVTFALT